MKLEVGREQKAVTGVGQNYFITISLKAMNNHCIKKSDFKLSSMIIV